MRAILVGTIFTAIVFGSCTPVLSPYTTRVQEETNLNDDEMAVVQFYLSSDVILYRNLSASETTVDNGEITIMNGQKVQQIIIPEETPGVIVGRDGDKLKVSFDTNGSYLLFGPNSDYGGRYTLMAKKWEGRTGIVDYEGAEYKTTPESIFAFLEVSLKEMNSRSVSSKSASGRKVGN